VDEAAGTPPPGPRPVRVDLEWQGGHRFRGTAEAVAITIDSPPRAGPSPVQLLAFGLAGCMATDVALVLARGRFPVKDLRARLLAERAPSDPRRLTAVDLHFTVTGEVPADRVERALALSRDKYCSVWHSMRRDIELRTTFEVVPE
jgi:putative redox protein